MANHEINQRATSSSGKFWLGMVLSVSILAVLLGLGFWQIARLHWKMALMAELDAAKQSAPIKFSTFDDRVKLTKNTQQMIQVGQKLTVIGTALSEKTIFLGNQFMGDQAGFSVLVPYQLASGKDDTAAPYLILVNHGFIAWPKNGNYHPQSVYKPVPDSSAPQEISGWLAKPSRPGYFTPKPKMAESLWYSADLADMAARLALPAATETEFYLVELPNQHKDAANVTDPGKPRPQNLPELQNPHLHYALTWFGLALIWSIFCGIFWRRRFLAVR